jgi:hypothetical protein
MLKQVQHDIFMLFAICATGSNMRILLKKYWLQDFTLRVD